MTIHTDSVWETVKQHPWKWRRRSRPIDAILWHSTRGGQWYDGDTELGAYMNWARSPNNIIRFAGGDFAGIASYGIGPGRIIQCVPDDILPAWSSWPSDEHALSVEVAQSNLGQPIEAATIAECVKFARWANATYGVPLTRVWPTNDQSWTGMAGHEDTVQGRASGKSDPGVDFWLPFMAALHEEADMTPEERAKLEAVYAALTGGIDSVITEWNARGNSLLLGYANEQAKLADHIANHAAGVTGPVPAHKHIPGDVQ